MPALQHLFARLQQATKINQIVFCTTEESSDDPLAALAQKIGIACHRGPTDDVLARMLGAIENLNP